MPQSFDNPLLLLGSPSPCSLEPSPTYLESLLCVVVRFLSALIPGWLYTDLPPFLPIPFSLSPTVPHFKYMPSYDDITVSASHIPIQFCMVFFLYIICYVITFVINICELFY